MKRAFTSISLSLIFKGTFYKVVVACQEVNSIKEKNICFPIPSTKTRKKLRTKKLCGNDGMNVDFVRELELCDKDGDDDRRVVRIDTSLDVGAMPFRQRMTWNFFDRQPKTNFMTNLQEISQKC